MDYDSIWDLVLREKRAWRPYHRVLGPPAVLTGTPAMRSPSWYTAAMCRAVLAGNALATHDLEAGYRSTALGQISIPRFQPGGHYKHIDTINQVRGLA